MNAPACPVLRYPGGKWKCAPWIISNFPRHEVYVEVFGGGASVLLQKSASRTEIYNDIDNRIVNVFRTLRDPEKATELIRLLDLTPFSSEEYADCYKESTNEIDDARMMIVRSFMGIGSDSVFRQNGFRRGFKNKKLDSNNIFFTYMECLPAFVSRLKNVIIENLDWKKVIRIYDSKETLFYVDPPYLDEVCTSRSVTYSHPFTREQHVELANVLTGVQGNVVISGYDSELYTSLFEGWFATTKKAISGMGKHRVEKIWIKRQENSLFRSEL